MKLITMKTKIDKVSIIISFNILDVPLKKAEEDEEKVFHSKWIHLINTYSKHK